MITNERQAHGGDIYSRPVKYDFSANLNPLGMPESVKKAAAAAVEKSGCYPDPYCSELVEKLASLWGKDSDRIVAGNGADDLIYRVAHALRPRRAVIPVPTFSEYSKALAEAGCSVTEHPLDERNGFAMDESILERLTDDTDMLVICDPNNPTGRLTERGLLMRIADRCAALGICLVCDECFSELAAERDESKSPLADVGGDVVILRAFTKTYAMAGLRLGYAVFGSSETARRVRNCGQFWSVSAPAQAAGIAALDETGYVERARALISAEREHLTDRLGSLGFTVYPSDTNFILFRAPDAASAENLEASLLCEGIAIRSCRNFSGLGERYFRTAVRLHDENEILIRAAERCVREWQKR